MFSDSENVLAALSPYNCNGLSRYALGGVITTTSHSCNCMNEKNLSDRFDRLKYNSNAIVRKFRFKFSYKNYSKEYLDFVKLVINSKLISTYECEFSLPVSGFCDSCSTKTKTNLIINKINKRKTLRGSRVPLTVISNGNRDIASNFYNSEQEYEFDKQFDLTSVLPVDDLLNSTPTEIKESDNESIQSSASEPDSFAALSDTFKAYIEAKLVKGLVKALELPVNIAFGLTSSIVAFLMSLFIVFKCKCTSKWITATPVVANFLAIFSWIEIWFTVTHIKIKPDYNHLTGMFSAFMELAKEYKEETRSTIANALVMPDWVNLFSHLFGYAIVGVMKLGFGWDLKTIKESLSIRREVLSLKTDICDVLKEFACDIGFTNLIVNSAQNSIYYDLLTTINELSQYHVIDYVTHPHRIDLLDKTILEISRNLAANNPKGKELGVIRNACAKELDNLRKMRKSLREAMTGNERQATVGFIFTGEAGIGKSYTVRQILRDVMALCGYKQEIYNLDCGVNDKYFPQYLNQAAGIYNEFAASVGESQSQIVTVINKIISGDSFNMEGADLPFKHQPCHLKLVGMTSNHKKFVFNNVLHDTANKALLSRLNTYEVLFPGFDDTKSRDDQQHKDDYSHLKFIYNKYNLKDGQSTAVVQNATQVEMTYKEVVRDLALKVLANEKAFYTSVSKHYTLNPEDTITVNGLLQSNEVRQLAARATISNAGLIGQIAPESNYLTFSFAGLPMKGKSQYTQVVAQHLSKQLNLQVVNNPNLSERFNKPSIILFDDLDVWTKFHEYNNFVDSLPPVSVILFTTNARIECKNYGFFSKPRFLKFIRTIGINDFFKPIDTFKFYRDLKIFYYSLEITNSGIQGDKMSGLFRRLGIMHDVHLRDGNSTILIPSCAGNYGRFFTLDECGTIYCKDLTMSKSKTLELITSIVCTRMSLQETLTKVPDSPPLDFSPDIELKIHNKKKFLETSQSVLGMTALVLNQYPKIATFEVTSAYAKEFKLKVNDSALMVPTLPADIEVSELLQCVAYALRSADPTCKLTIECENTKYAITSGFIYTMDVKTEPSVVTGKEGVIYYKDTPISTADYVRLRKRQHLNSAHQILKQLDENTISSILIRINQIVNSNPLQYAHYMESLALVESERTEALGMIGQIIKHRYFKICSILFTALIGIIVAFTTVWILKNRFFPNKEEEIFTCNNSPQKHERIGKTMQKFLKHNPTQESWEQYAAGQGFSSQEILDYDNWRHSNSYQNTMDPDAMKATCAELINAIKRNNPKTVELLYGELTKHGPITPEILKCLCTLPASNAVQVSDEITRNSSVIGEFAKTLRNNVCAVQGDAGNCYGIFIEDKYFVTVSHIFSNVKSKMCQVTCTVNGKSGKNRYVVQAEILHLNREKDMTLCRVIDRQFPNMPSIKKNLLCTINHVDWSGTCYYVRPFEVIEIYGGSASFSNRRIPARDPMNKFYQPTTAFVFEATTFNNYGKQIYASGDCGLPLLTLIDNQVKIVGIHNAYTVIGLAWFSPFFKEVYEMFFERDFSANANIKFDHDIIGVPVEHKPDLILANVPNYQPFGIDDRMAHTKFPDLNKHPDIFKNIGYVPALNKPYDPRHDHVCNWRQAMHTKLSALPSCVSPKYIPEEVLPSVPRSSCNEPEPAITQFLKFNNDLKETFDPDLLRQAEEVRETFAELTYDFDEFKTLSLAHSINGAPGTSMKPIDLNTSPGLYLSKKFKLQNKENAFIIHEHANGPNQIYVNNSPAGLSIKRDFEAIISCWNQGQPVRIVVADTKKVEILPMEKVMKDANVRIFNVLDTATNLALRSKFGMFNDQCVRASTISHTVYGANPYRLYPWLLTSVRKDFKSLSSDVSRIDKTLSPTLIRSIIKYIGWLYTGDRNDKCYAAIAESFIHVTHLFHGVAFETCSGNPSGCYLTVLLNTEARFIIDLYILCRMWREIPPEMKLTPFSDIQQNTRIFITGDDEQMWFNDRFFHVTDDMLVNGYAEFGLKLVVDKNSDIEAPQFCSRYMLPDKETGIVFFALKKSSIEKMLHYSLPERENLRLNLITAVFEATFWDEKYYKKIRRDAILLIKYHGLGDVYLPEYKLQRQHYAEYVRGFKNCPILTERGADVLLRYLNIDMDSQINTKITCESENYVSIYNVYHQRDPAKYPIPSETREKRPNGEWFLSGTVGELTFTGAGPTVSAAKQQVYKQFVLARAGEECTANANIKPIKRHKHSLIYTIDERPDGDGYDFTVIVDDKVVRSIKTSDPEKVQRNFKMFIQSSLAFQNFNPTGRLFEPLEITSDNTANSSTGQQIKPNMAGGSAVPGATPSSSSIAPQATSVQGEQGPVAQVLDTTGGANETVVLNPYGPANLMTQGAAVFSLVSLITDQFIDKDVEITISDSTPIGTKLFEIPYDPLGEYINTYIKNYAQYHSRFNGDIIIRIQVIGNPLFTGAIAIGWSPEQLVGQIIPCEQYQKYAYKVFSLQQSSVQEFVLKDARQYEYYRDFSTFRKGENATKVPFLTAVCHVTVQNALKEGALVRIRIGSRLASATDVRLGKMVQPFQFANPIPVPFSITPGNTSINGLAMNELFPNLVTSTLNAFTDGTQYLGVYTTLNGQGKENFFSMQTSLPCLVGGQYIEPEKRRLVTSSLETHVFGTDILRIVSMVTQFGAVKDSAIAKDLEFVNVTSNKDTWLANAEAANFLANANIIVNVKRNITVALEIYKKDTYIVQVVQQTTVMTDHGMAYIFCITANPASNDIKLIAPVGIANTSSQIDMFYPHSSALGAIVTNQDTVSLPVTWKNFVITNHPITTVNAQTELAPSGLTLTYILMYFNKLTQDYAPTQCAEFDLVDPISKNIVMTLRYLPTANLFVIRPMDTLNYATFPGDVTKLIVNRFTKTETSSPFNQTDTSTWLSRAGTGVDINLQNLHPTYYDHLETVCRNRKNRARANLLNVFSSNNSNALIAAEGLLGEETMMRMAGVAANDAEFNSTLNELRGLTGAPRISGRSFYTQTNNSTREAFSQTPSRVNQGFTPLKQNLTKASGQLPSANANTNIKQIFNLGHGTENSYDNEHFMKELLVNIIPIELMQQNQSNGNVMGVMTNSAFEEMGISKDDYAYKHEMDIENHREDFERQQNQSNQDFTAGQNELNRQQQEQLQKNKFAEEEKMQQQQNLFTAGENTKNRELQQQMQQRNFENQTAQSELQFKHSQQLQTQKFGEDLTLTAVSGGLNLASHAMDDLTSVYNTKQKIAGESELQAQRANEAMYVAGASAQSMQLSSQQ